jgi:hypothetical protein
MSQLEAMSAPGLGCKACGRAFCHYVGGATDRFEGDDLCGPCANAARMQFELETHAADLDLLAEEDAFERALDFIVVSHAQSEAYAQ